MTQELPQAIWLELSQLIARRFGLHFPPDRMPDLFHAVAVSAEECKRDLEPYILQILASSESPGDLESLVRHLTVGETYFLREKRQLEILTGEILPPLLRTRTRHGAPVRLWSAGCATGEEAYSLAILLSETLPSSHSQPVILGTDLNPRSLATARQAIYPEWSFRRTPRRIREEYFEKTEDDRFALRASTREMVTFLPLNLADETWSPIEPRSFDVILCRNVLMYFTPTAMREVIQRFHRSLREGGWLIFSASENCRRLASNFAAVSFGDVTLYRKVAPATSVPSPPGRPGKAERRAHSVPAKCTRKPATVPAPTVVCASKSSSLAVYQQALALYNLGSYEKASQKLSGLLAVESGNGPAAVLLSRIYADQKRLDEALHWCDKALVAARMSAETHYLRALILLEQGRVPEALAALQQTVYLEPDFTLGHLALANLLSRLGKREQSERHFANASALQAGHRTEEVHHGGSKHG
jgi:chemotaxis protein methyltransferase CheR